MKARHGATAPPTGVALAHDYLTQRGGAERVVLTMMRAFPEAPLYTSLYDAEGTFSDFAFCDVRTGPLDRWSLLRRHHRLALPLLAPSFSAMFVDASVLLCSSSGWAHGMKTNGAKVVYCYNPARWLYQTAEYLGTGRPAARAAISLLGPPLRAWDRAAAAGARRYLVSSRAVRLRVQERYGRDAEILPPPPALGAGGPQSPVPGLEEGYLLCVSRLLPYKNVAPLLEAVGAEPDRKLVVVGTGPQEAYLRARAPSNARFLGHVPDEQLRWLYSNCSAVVTPSYEDFGLVPLEAAGFGRPAVSLRWGGFLDTVMEGENGVFFDSPEPALIRGALRAADDVAWSREAIQRGVERFAEPRFIERLRQVVAEEAGT